MTTAYTSLLGLALPVQGELSGTWGDVVNQSITSLVDTSVAGTTNVSADSNVTLTTTTGASNQARQAILLFSGARTAIRTVTAPAQSKIYTVINATTGGFAVQLVGAGPTTGLTIPNGASATVAWNGSDFIEVGTSSIGNLTVNGTLTVTGVSIFSAGSAAAPAITTTGDTNTGIFFPAADTIAFAEGGVEAARFDSSGNLGIGTTSPSGRLHVANTGTAGTTADNLAVYFSSTNRNSNVYILAKNTDGSNLNFGDGDSSTVGRISYDHASNYMAFDANGSERMRLDSSGNLGLGVTPSAWISSYRAFSLGYSSNGMFSGANTQLGLTQNAYLDSGVSWRYTTSNPASQYIQSSGAHTWFNAASGTAGNAITFTQAMTLDSSGYLLVGATSSDGVGASRLQVGSSGATSQLLVKSSGGHTALYVTGADAYHTWASGGFLAFGHAPANGSTFTERARIDSSGNLGIGTSSPSSKLTVVGVVKSASGTQSSFYLSNAAQTNGFLVGRSLGSTDSQDFFIYDTVAAATRMVIDSSGKVFFNTTSEAGTADSVVTIKTTSGASLARALALETHTTSDIIIQTFRNPNGQVGSISTNGSATSYNTSSDQRLKENIQDADSASSLIDALQVRKFDWKSDNSHQRYGFVAQELATVAPEAVHQPEDTEAMMAVDYSKLVPMLVKEIQSLRKRLADAGI
jgi:hypothetical protein